MTRVFVQLKGGLGNQLFQYAAGRAVAVRNNSELLLDTRIYTTNCHRLYSLNHFCIKASVAAPSQLPPPRTSRIRNKLWRALGRHPRYFREHIHERGYALNVGTFALGPECYLDGYFLSEDYFADIKDRLHSELDFRSDPKGPNKEMLTRIASENSVALHVRRGDYLNYSSDYFPVLGQSYYDAAIAYIAERVDRPVIHVFSDCPSWVRDNCHFDYPTIVHDQNQETHLNHEDLRLMSACRHNITANSTFSWWGAWLNPNPGKIVVTPKTWFGKLMPSVPDLIPSAWHRISN